MLDGRKGTGFIVGHQVVLPAPANTINARAMLKG